MNIGHPMRPRIALGTWAWGDSGNTGEGYFGSDMTRSGLEEVVDKAHAAGFTLWDTARVYGMGRSETLLGELLKRYPRSDYQISTKFTPQLAGEGDDPVGAMLDQSLSAIDTDYIDLYWIHNPGDVNRWTPHLIPLLKSGRVKHVGVSNHNLNEIKLADSILRAAGFRVEAVQNHFSLLYRSPEQAGILDYCREQGIPFFAYMVLEQGALTRKYNSENPLPAGSDRAKYYNEILPRLTALKDVLGSIGLSQDAEVHEVATAWALAHGATPIIGVTKPGHIDSLVRAGSITLTSDNIAGMEALADAAHVDTRGWWEKNLLA